MWLLFGHFLHQHERIGPFGWGRQQHPTKFSTDWVYGTGHEFQFLRDHLYAGMTSVFQNKAGQPASLHVKFPNSVTFDITVDLATLLQ